MQIRRYDLEPHHVEPKGPVRPGGASQGTGLAATDGPRKERSTTDAGGPSSQYSGLIERFQSQPLVRASAVEAAKAKLIRGEYGTREAAERLANTELRHEFF
ncbi:hypothetical protein [Planctomicrobium sp. SH664]|uniref:hypothetical protein n=1 Tax=Planctomicrobium sp. SH664 TaxID=3448125 RepID=UPI003F5BE3CB